MLILAFADRALDVIGLIYVVRVTWLFAKGHGLKSF